MDNSPWIPPSVHKQLPPPWSSGKTPPGFFVIFWVVFCTLPQYVVQGCSPRFAVIVPTHCRKVFWYGVALQIRAMAVIMERPAMHELLGDVVCAFVIKNAVGSIQWLGSLGHSGEFVTASSRNFLRHVECPVILETRIVHAAPHCIALFCKSWLLGLFGRRFGPPLAKWLVVARSPVRSEVTQTGKLRNKWFRTS